MQQQATSMMPVMPSFPPANITTEQIQKYLDENKKLILAILDNQNLGKLAECAQYQAQLQKNLMYLAAIADAQPQMATMPAQMAPHPAMQQQAGAYYMQQQAAAAMAAAAQQQQQQQQGVFPPRMPAQFASPLQLQQQQHQLQQQHHQAMAGQLSFRPAAGPTNGMHPMQTESMQQQLGGGSSGGGPPPTSAGPSKQDGPEGGDGGGQGGSAAGGGGKSGSGGGEGEEGK